MSVEIPQEYAILDGQSVTQRAQQAVKSVKQI